MTAFLAVAGVLVALALALLLRPLLRAHAAPGIATSASVNASIYREQLAELEAERASGALAPAQFDRAHAELERRIVAENPVAEPAQAGALPLRKTALALALLVPLAAGLGYFALGNPAALDPRQTLAAPDPKEIEALTDRLAAHLEKNPEDAHGWSLLARALSALGKYDGALKAYAKAVQLVPDDPGLLADFLRTLALAGRDEYERGNYTGAIAYWEKILPFAPPQSEFGRSIVEGIAEAKAKGNIASAPAGPSIQGTVRLDPSVAAKAAPGDTVFVIARAAEGPRMPLAVARTTVAALPYRFTLDDSMAMAPNAKLSGQAKVVVAARVSKSGKAAPEPGDLEGVSAPVAPGATGVDIVVRKVLP